MATLLVCKDVAKTVSESSMQVTHVVVERTVR